MTANPTPQERLDAMMKERFDLYGRETAFDLLARLDAAEARVKELEAGMRDIDKIVYCHTAGAAAKCQRIARVALKGESPSPQPEKSE